MNTILNEEDLCLAIDTINETLEELYGQVGNDAAKERCTQAGLAMIAITEYLQGVVK